MTRILLVFCAVFITQLLTAQMILSKNFEFNSIRYEYQLFKSDDKHVGFKISNVASAAVWKESRIYLNEFDKSLFDPEFLSIVSSLDANLAVFLAAAAANQTSFDQIRDELYKKSIEKILEKSPQQEEIEELQKKIKDILGEDETQEALGKLVMVRRDVNVYSAKGVVARTSKVKEIEVTISMGGIVKRGLKVTLEDGTIFFNLKDPVNFPGYFKRKRDQIFRYDRRKDSANLYVELGDVMDYHFFGTLNYPSDGKHLLTQEHPFDTLRIGSSLNSLIEVTAYTDLLGLLGRKANGLLQTELSGNFITNSGNIYNTDITFHTFMRPYIRLTKFDSKFSSLDSSNIKPGIGGRDTVNRTFLNQISYLQAGLKINIIRFRIGVNQAVYFNVGTDINLVSTDSLYKKDILYFNYYPEFHYTVYRLKNFGTDCSLKFLRQRLGDNTDLVNKNFIWVFQPQITLNYYTSKKEENRVYFRVGYFDNLNDSKYNFAQFQLGYKSSIKLK
jgi:hypothetical protein